MFRPQIQIPGEAPVPDSLWPSGITIVLSPDQGWIERKEFYSSLAYPAGLDPERWKVVGSRWHAVILFDTRGNTDYSIDDRSYFYVLEDLSKNTGEEGKFSLFRWEDLGSAWGPTPEMRDGAGTAPTRWTALKVLFR